MGDDAIFFKTLSGDEAVRERTRLVQRNLRMVLILVDGFADVAALKTKVGDPAMVESALAELERLGLVESIDARMARNKESAAVAALPQEEPAAVVDAVVTAPAEVPAEFDIVIADEPPILTDVVAPPVEPVAEAPLTDSMTVFDEETATKVWMIPGFAAPADLPPAPKPSPLAKLSAWWEKLRSSRARAKEEAIYEKAYGQPPAEPEGVVLPASEPKPLPVVEPELEPEPAPVPGDIKIKPVRRKPRLAMGWGRKLILSLLVLILAGLLGLVFFPYDSYRPDFEQTLSRALGEPVTVQSVDVTFTPYPAITLSGVSVGQEPYASADTVYLLPEPVSLLGSHRYLQVQVRGPRLKQAGLPRLSRWLTPGALGEITIDRLEVEGLSLDLGRYSVDGLNLSLPLEARQQLGKLIYGNDAAPLRVSLVPGSQGLAWTLAAAGWKLPVRPELHFDRLEARGMLVPGRLTIEQLEGQLYDGRVGGSGQLVWDEEATLSLALEFERLLADKLLATYGAEPRVDGLLGGKLKLAARAKSFRGLADAVRMDGSFQVDHGSLGRIDLAEALRSAGKLEPITGGTTRFEEFSGVFAMDDKAVRLARLKLASGLMHAFGQVTVSRQNGAISGGGTAEMRGTATTVRTSVNLSGKAADPALKAGS
jgi:hypothetical protein